MVDYTRVELEFLVGFAEGTGLEPATVLPDNCFQNNALSIRLPSKDTT